jgi:predicted RNase H-like nuclease (RuvC/YqgF family)
VIGQREQIINLNAEYCRNITQAREELLMNRLEEQEMPAATSMKRLEEKERRELERRIQDLSKTNRQITAELEKSRRKCEVVQEKYQSIKNLVSKDKNIGTQELPSFTKPDRRTGFDKNKNVIDELDGMLDNIDRLKKVKSSTNLDEYGSDYRNEHRGER